MALAQKLHHSANRAAEPDGEPQLQARVQRHYMEDMGNVCPFVQILELPVPQMVDNVMDSSRFMDLPIAEQVIEVPKVSSSCPSRAVLREPQMAQIQFRMVMVLVVGFKVFLPDRAPHNVLWSRTLIFQFRVLVPAVVLRQDRMRSAQWSRSSIFPFLARAMVEVFLVFTFNRVPQPVVELLFPGARGMLVLLVCSSRCVPFGRRQA